ncbi:uncharacterized protein LOC123219676 [Mangifera indica]|uniref:uncharacterized protein LOC123219676 n=1 Tax=Mangifera indica TaxID=29780 RepID=UPI001CFAAD53|nr:uncharacterized protein LOC123219676 [Mangifera indica]
MAVLETKVGNDRLSIVNGNIWREWENANNNDSHPNGRIWVGWNKDTISFNVIEKNPQFIHGEAWLVEENSLIALTIVYGYNQPMERRRLWKEIDRLSNGMGNKPWLIMGDFNAIRGPSEKIGGVSWGDTYSDDLNKCCEEANLEDLRYMGNQLTWSNCSEGHRRIACKLDRALVNEQWKDVFEESFAMFLNHSISDHSPCIVTCGGGVRRRRVPFKFYNMWATHDNFLNIVRESWQEDVEGSPMYKLISKLKRLKKVLRRLNKEGFWRISEKVEEAKGRLEDVQNRLQSSPLNEDLAKEEKAVQHFFSSGHLLKEVNCTILALVPKVANASRCMEYRPIACCNIIYKCISKILANRLKAILPSFIDKAQGAFVGGRCIGENIMLCQDLMHNYHRVSKDKKCAMKIDLLKAYDTVHWDFILAILEAIGFHGKFIGWIRSCISTPSFSLGINGELVGFFKSSHGLRADVESLTLMKSSLKLFHEWSGLQMNCNKSNIYISGLPQEEKIKLADSINVEEIDGILRDFLWNGAAMDGRKAKVAWEEVCVPKEEGGLGIMRCKVWNKAAITKNMWKILLDKGNSLWVEWIKHALVKEVIDEHGWKWPAANSCHLMEIKGALPCCPMGGEDALTWAPNSNGKFTIKSAWEIMRSRKDKVEWCERLLSRHNLGACPRWRFEVESFRGRGE